MLGAVGGQLKTQWGINNGTGPRGSPLSFYLNLAVKLLVGGMQVQREEKNPSTSVGHSLPGWRGWTCPVQSSR